MDPPQQSFSAMLGEDDYDYTLWGNPDFNPTPTNASAGPCAGPSAGPNAPTPQPSTQQGEGDGGEEGEDIGTPTSRQLPPLNPTSSPSTSKRYRLRAKRIITPLNATIVLYRTSSRKEMATVSSMDICQDTIHPRNAARLQRAKHKYHMGLHLLPLLLHFFIIIKIMHAKV